MSTMAVDDVKSNGSRKRKRGSMKRKLLVNERVEECGRGISGVVAPGTVIHCGKQKRNVRYDNVLQEDGSSYVVDVVSVSPVLDDATGAGGIGLSNCNERGFIRPVPPLVEFGGWDLLFGLCVDVSYQEAWWEGVVFDHCDGKEERRVFFPDLGDEMRIGIHQLRISQDWDEATGDWKLRGNWAFLELVEECERVSFVAVSVKQIWYDVRIRKEFESIIRDWTCSVKDLWRDIVTEIIGDYYALTIQEILPALKLPRDFLEETPEVESVEPTAIAADSDASPMNQLCSNIGTADTSIEECDLTNMVDTDQNCAKYDTNPLVDEASNVPIIEELNVVPEEEEDEDMLTKEEPVSPIQEIFSEDEKEVSCRRRAKRSISCWKPLILSEVELCPDVISRYTLGSDSKTIRELLKTKARKHLAYLGWTIEWTEDRHIAGRRRYRYRSPGTQGQKVYTSILKACKHLQQDSNVNSAASQNDQNSMHYTDDTSILNLLSEQTDRNKDQHVDSPVLASSSPSVQIVEEPEFCPEAVVKYYLHTLENHQADKRKWKLKAKQHLLAEGWSFDYPTENRRRTLYKSPKNQTLGSLQGACRLYIKESIPKWTLSVVNEGSVDRLDSDDLLQCISQLLKKEPELHATDGLTASTSAGSKKRKSSKSSKASSRKRQRNGLTRVLQSRKTVQKVLAPGVLHETPQNIVSWLIDCSMVQPRSKVYCKGKGGRNPTVSEGRISREGIKCSCCQKIYGVGGFVNHAGGNSNRSPSASIFLKDGRSLLGCQIQVMHDKRKEETKEEPSNDLCQGESDNICSICHYGGKLILCDQCPSAFHKKCLGLQEIPDGDWFCPSCRCGLCSQTKVEGTEDARLLTCAQCERKYHDGCLRNGTRDKSRRYQANWFCRKECEQIYDGLNKLLGKPVSMDEGNLTWTLIKCVNSERCDASSTKNEGLVESYSKLSVALSVMHECFEPLQNPSSSRDLMEDVIFSRWSELNRANFQGFYTVLLERNEELISVATVRIYGEKVAELPLVGTRFQYRRLGMCRILMNELEKMLMNLGVERLVLPAVPGMLETWTGSFGFNKMTKFERSQFLDYTFLDFQGTIMCQKLLRKKIPSPESVLTRETQQSPPDDVSSVVKCKIDFDKFSPPESDEFQAEETDKSRTTDLRLVECLTSVRN